MKIETCESCGRELGPDAPGGLCPRCLMGHVMAGDGEPPVVGTRSGDPAGGAVPSPEDVAGRLPGYDELELVGDGGMGVVYRGVHQKLGRPVAIKILRPALSEDGAFADRFLREARALARLDHANVVKVYDFGEAGGLFYLVMEYVEGTNLRALLAGRELPPEQALAIVPQICDALQYAHGQGVVHRDIKPENILLDADGRVRIADFGLAKLADAEGPRARLTGTGQVMGTPHYMAPEQVENPLKVDHRADIYSLGVVLYEMLTGQLPIGRFAAPSERTGGSAGLDRVVLRALEREPDRRYQQASEVRTEVEAAGTAPPEPPVAAVPPRPSRVSWGPILAGLLLAAAIVLMLLVALGLSMFQSERSGAEEILRARRVAEERAEQERDRQLLEGARDGNRIHVESALASGADPNLLTNISGFGGRRSSALELAVEGGQTEIVRMLLDAGALPDLTTGTDERAIHLACELGHAEITALLLRAGADANARHGGWTPLVLAARKGHWTSVHEILGEAERRAGTEGARALELDVYSLHERTALFHAVATDEVPIVRRLLSLGADPDLPDRNTGSTPLIYAIRKGFPEVVAALLEGGADPELSSRVKQGSGTRNVSPPLHVASELGRADMVRALLDAGADVESVANGHTPLTRAAEKGSVAVIELLLERGADAVAAVNGRGPIDWARETRNEAAAARLVEAAADAHAARARAAFDALGRWEHLEDARVAFSELLEVDWSELEGAVPCFEIAATRYWVDAPRLTFELGLAETLYRDGDTEGAREAYQRCLDLWPGQGAAKLYRTSFAGGGGVHHAVTHYSMQRHEIEALRDGADRLPIVFAFEGESGSPAEGLVH